MARPAQYDHTQVLNTAAQVFWDKGYAGTSMADLVGATGLKPGSLYAAFDNKQGLFDAAIDHYAQAGLKGLKAALEQDGSYLDNIRQAFLKFIDGDHTGQPQGCFLVNALIELSPHDEQMQQRLKSHTANVESLFKNALAGAKAAGELPESANVKQLAKQIMISLWGVRVAQRRGLTNAERNELKACYATIV